MRLEDINRAIRQGRLLVTDHADEEARADQLTLDEVEGSVHEGEIIKEYPEDRPYPSCLV